MLEMGVCEWYVNKEEGIGIKKGLWRIQLTFNECKYKKSKPERINIKTRERGAFAITRDRVEMIPYLGQTPDLFIYYCFFANSIPEEESSL